MLSPYLIIDCSGRMGWLAGRILGDMGANLIKIEQPGADISNHDWQAYNVNKRLLTLDLTEQEGRDRLDELLAVADFLLETAPPSGELRDFFDYKRLSAINPGLIQVSITPFGLSGPRAEWLASDMELMAAGGAMSLAGRPGETPLRVTVPQSHSWAGAHAASGALTALAHRQTTGIGQQVDVSAQASIISALAHAPTYPETTGTVPTRSGEFIPGRSVTGARFRVFWECRDGYVNFILYGGIAGRRTNRQLVTWMTERGAELGPLGDIDWASFDIKLLTQEEILQLEEPLMRFFARLTKAEFLEETAAREMLGYPVSTVGDIRQDPQLEARGFWQKAKDAEGVTRSFCGSFVVVDGQRPAIPAHDDVDDLEVHRLVEKFASRKSTAAGGSPETGAPASAKNRALAGVNVVEFGGYAAGPQIGKNLANFGATVVHVESFGRPDGFRVEYPPYKDGKPGVNRAAMFNFFNDSKYGVTLDLKKDEGKELARRLLAWCDVVIENMRPGVMARLGLGYEEMKAINPRLVMLSTCNMGQTGPRANTPGFGTQLSALAGFCGLTGFPDGPPMLLFGPYIDFIASTMGTAAALAGLDRQRRQGTGCWIDLSQYESGLHFIAGALLEAECTGRIRERAGNWDPVAAPHNAYPCREDDWLTLSCWSDGEFSNLVKAMERPDLEDDQRFSTVEKRRSNSAELDALITAWCATKAADATATLLQEAGVHAYQVNTVADLFTDPQIDHYKIWQKRRHSVVGEHHCCNPPFLLSATPGDIYRPAPCLGEHNEIVFKEILGLSEEEYRDYDDHGAFD